MRQLEVKFGSLSVAAPVAKLRLILMFLKCVADRPLKPEGD